MLAEFDFAITTPAKRQVPPCWIFDLLGNMKPLA
jgi:hypothetical protein